MHRSLAGGSGEGCWDYSLGAEPAGNGEDLSHVTSVAADTPRESSVCGGEYVCSEGGTQVSVVLRESSCVKVKKTTGACVCVCVCVCGEGQHCE